MSPRTIRVEFKDGRGYDILIGRDVLRQVPGRIESILGAGAKAFIIHDRGVPESVLNALASGFKHPGVASWEPSESLKVTRQSEQFLQAIAAARLDRTGFIAALGGGITGDIAGFAAAVYQRGVPWVNCPSTLLAMVDASIGGKTGVNLSLPGDEPQTLKNMVGAFHQPALVAADIDLLASLSARDFRCGLAECIKHAMIATDWGDEGLLSWTSANLAAIRDRHPDVLTELVARNVSIKAAVVQADEGESGVGPTGGRMALNLGHTFAHVIETLPGLAPDGQAAPLRHGEAVALGLVAASRCAAAAGLWAGTRADEIATLIRQSGLPTSVTGLPPSEAIIERMAYDKKARGGKLRLMLPCGRGRVRVVDDPDLKAVRAGLDSIRG